MQQPDLSTEFGLWAQGYRYLAGLDEAGRGAWAGPVVAAAVILPSERADLAEMLAPVRDSKLLSPRQRERCLPLITQVALSHGVGAASAEEIDRLGIVPATRLAMARAVAALDPVPHYLLIDALRLPALALPQWARPKADRDCLSVAAASILAKVTRDRWMAALDDALPAYGMARHKGYGTAQHLAALRQFGPCAYHRRSFAPVRALLEGAASEACHG